MSARAQIVEPQVVELDPELVLQLPEQVQAMSPEEQKAYVYRVIHHQRGAGQQHCTCHHDLRDRYLRAIERNFRPIDPELYKFDKKILAPSLRDWLENKTLDPDGVPTVLTKVRPGLYGFDCFTPEFCSAIIKEIRHFYDVCKQSGVPVSVPNSMNNYGAILDDFGFRDLLDEMMREVVQSLSRHVFRAVTDVAPLDQHHGFVVEYAMDKDRDLGFHVDDAEITMNACLGIHPFSGGEVQFLGVRCPQHVSTTARDDIESYTHTPVPGKALLHMGKHRHLVKSLKSGNRLNLILWCRSSGYRARFPTRGHGPCQPYCWFERDPETTEKQAQLKN